GSAAASAGCRSPCPCSPLPVPVAPCSPSNAKSPGERGLLHAGARSTRRPAPAYLADSASIWNVHMVVKKGFDAWKGRGRAAPCRGRPLQCPWEPKRERFVEQAPARLLQDRRLGVACVFQCSEKPIAETVLEPFDRISLGVWRLLSILLVLREGR